LSGPYLYSIEAAPASANHKFHAVAGLVLLHIYRFAAMMVCERMPVKN
jgi:hypothetical protein